MITSAWTTSNIHRPNTTKRPTFVTTSTEKPRKECEHGQYYPYPNSCTNFLVCVNGNLVSQQCGPGLNWNEERNMCDWAYKKPCSEKPMKNALLVAKDTVTKVDCIQRITRWPKLFLIRLINLTQIITDLSNSHCRTVYPVVIVTYLAIAVVIGLVCGAAKKSSVAHRDCTSISIVVFVIGHRELIVKKILTKRRM